jgi:hypothetical protein
LTVSVFLHHHALIADETRFGLADERKLRVRGNSTAKQRGQGGLNDDACCVRILASQWNLDRGISTVCCKAIRCRPFD